MIAIKSINTLPTTKNSLKKHEKGITLIMVLIFIVTLSLVAAVGMRSVISSERVVANELDKTLAFQAAESAGREGVAKIVSVYESGGTFPASTLATPHPLGGNAIFWRTSSELSESSGCIASNDETKRFNWPTCSEEAASAYVKQTQDTPANNASIYGNAVKPRYVIEKLAGTLSPTTGKADCWYRVTSRATGGSASADVILQVMFSQTITGLPSACL